MTDKTCANCRFRMPDDRPEHVGSGQCRRNPPTVVSVPTTPRVADDTGQGAWIEQHWPWMTAADWCGEWKQGAR